MFLHKWRHKDVWGSGSAVPLILRLSTRWRSMDSFTSRPLYTRETASSTRWTGGFVGPRAGLDISTAEKFSCLCSKSNHSSSERGLFTTLGPFIQAYVCHNLKNILQLERFLLTCFCSSKNLVNNFYNTSAVINRPSCIRMAPTSKFDRDATRFLQGYIQIALRQLSYHSRLRPIVRIARCGQHHKMNMNK